MLPLLARNFRFTVRVVGEIYSEMKGILAQNKTLVADFARKILCNARLWNRDFVPLSSIEKITAAQNVQLGKLGSECGADTLVRAKAGIG